MSSILSLVAKPVTFILCLAIAVATTPFTATLAQQDTPEMTSGTGLGPAIGETIPHDLALGDAPGFDALTGENGMVLFFVRSVDWCPYCKAQVIEASAAYDDFTALGLEPVYLSYDTAEKQTAFAAQRDIAGSFISDPQSEIITAFGLLNTNHKPGEFGHGIPFPAIFILDADGTVAARLYEEEYLTNAKSYQDRPAIDIVLEAAAKAVSE
ncbi:peroxiredoxin family protein [Aquisalinus flavus]|uniref:Thioredoxin domain-containing protein n=1 Tax=Aquisalinus flavus TaxID=1526572 RepID=A0A8J2V657_9PROT|nr:peroxiredoxin family protein [Aquisalinus flavus]MBD0425676.1 peroxiredoxin family protein [Aquisalinus flavus]UNE48711.1 peroxiredoxin family protein [Aquisalinus flavus]GGD14167.1 hypothetical protein GCM10011342_23650 [Aquisalinus flavus]